MLCARPRGLFTWEMEIDLPVTLPLEIRVFLAWLVIVLWRRQAQHD